MFCRTCGTENHNNALYCVHDGAILKDYTNSSIKLKKKESKFCSSCSHDNDSSVYYCINCGHSFEKAIQVKRSTTVEMVAVANVEPSKLKLDILFSKQQIVTTVLYAGGAVLIMMLMAFLLNSALKQLFYELLEGEIPLVTLENLTITTFADFVMFFHLVGMALSSGFALFGDFTFNVGISLFLIVPAIILTLIGFLLSRKMNQHTVQEKVATSLVFSFVYALIIFIFSFLASGEIYYPADIWFSDALYIAKQFSGGAAFLHAFLISAIFTTLGLMMATKDNLPLQQSTRFDIVIKQAILAVCLGIVIVTGVSHMNLKTEEVLRFEGAPVDLAPVINTQVGSYAWNLAQFGKVELTSSEGYDSFGINYSIVQDANLIYGDEYIRSSFREGVREFKNEFGIGSLWGLVLIPIALHIWSGIMITRRNNKSLHTKIILYAFVFAIVNAILASFSAIQVMASDFSIQLSVTTFSYVISFILAMLCAYLGSIIHEKWLAPS